MKINLILFFLFLLNQGFADGLTVISGNAIDYAGSEIQFYKYADPISEVKQELFHLKIDTDGNFDTSVQLDEVTHAFAGFDSYFSNVYLIPGKTYQIILPPRKKITSSQRNNPFFKPINVHLAVRNSDKNELNRKIREFDNAYYNTEGNFFDQIYRNKSTTAVDSVHTIMSRNFPETSDPFFEDYKFHRLAFAEYALHKGENKDFTLKYFNEYKINFSLAPFKTMFNRIYSNFFSELSNSVEGGEFRKILSSFDPAEIERYLIKSHFLSSEIAQLVILKSIHDAFHQGQFSQKSLLAMLAKIQKGNWSSDKKAIAQRLEEKLTHLLPGTQAPGMELEDFDKKRFFLSDFEGKLIYLHFTRVSNPICRQHLDALKKLREAVIKDVQIINLILEEEASRKEQILKQNWVGQFYVVTDKIAEQWKIKSFPTSFLIDESGKLIYSPANNPLDGFAKQIGTFLQKRHLEKLRNQAR